MKRAAWIKADAILGKPHQSLQAKMIVKTSAELGRWVAAHLEQGYTVTLTKVAERHQDKAIHHEQSQRP